MSTVSYDFEFEIGDVVRHSAAPPAGHEYNGIQRLVVIGRVAEQCHGGVQGHYHVRAVGQDGNFAGPLVLTAPEVAAYPTEGELADLKAEQKAREVELAEAARARRAARTVQEGQN